MILITTKLVVGIKIVIVENDLLNFNTEELSSAKKEEVHKDRNTKDYQKSEH